MTPGVRRWFWLLPFLLLPGCLTVGGGVQTPASRSVTAMPPSGDAPLHLVPLSRPDSNRFGVVVWIPLARGQIGDPDQLQILGPGGSALPVSRHTRLNWPARGDEKPSPRVVEVRIAESANELLPITLRVHINDTPVPNDSTPVPRPLPAAAVLPPQWNIAAHLFSRSLPITPNSGWFDGDMLHYAATATNHVSPAVSAAEKIDFTHPAPWLFDHAGLLFQLYFRSGDLKLFTEAEKASREYALAIGRDGYFRLKPGDLKYVYARPLMYRWMLFGEDDQLPRIRAMASAASGWPADGHGAGFWTERHDNYALAAAVHAWEITGESQYKDRIGELLDGLAAMSKAPLSDGLAANCPAHTLRAHEGDDSDQPVCSPWMMALLGQTLDYYYQLSGDERARDLLVRFNHFLLNGALYRVPPGDPNIELRGMILPWYLATRGFTYTDDGPYGDLEHTCDVAGLLARTGYYRAQEETLPAKFHTDLDGLMKSCQFDLNMWHRPGSAAQYGKPVWRLSPPRKFNWWFGSTQDLTWLLARER